MTDKTKYYLGMTASYIAGAIVTPFFFICITVIRLALCLWGIAYDTFMFTPRVVMAWDERFWVNLVESKSDKNNLN